MWSPDSHPSDQDLLSAVDGELQRDRANQVKAHLESCWQCRTRTQDIERLIADFIHLRGSSKLELPPPDGAKSILRLRISELEAASRPTLGEQLVAVILNRRYAAFALVGLAGVLIGMLVLNPEYLRKRQVSSDILVRSIPDPQLTPGATLPVTKADVCAAGTIEAARIVPTAVASEVFAAYGINKPEPRAYEVDYLITPALGGSDNVRNFWPQPYRNTLWNAHIKDALEDHLRRLVCEGRIDLVTAQSEIAHDWIGAYKKYFQTTRPLPEHNSFLKDQPWE
jgi:hypothetical protein